MDRDTQYSEEFRGILDHADINCVRLPPRSPNLSPHIKRFMRSIKEECLSRMILFGETPLRKAFAAYLAHYHQERNYQSLDNRIIEPGNEIGQRDGQIKCRERLGGMLRYYHHAA
jgi:putative transposase